MREGTKRAGAAGFLLLLVLALPVPPVRADADRARADRFCEKAETAERDAGVAERESEKRRRFLKGKDGIVPGTRLAPAGDTAAVRQSVQAQTAQARTILAQLRQGAESATRDRGIVPGLAQYFNQVESSLGRMLQAVDACLDNPGGCNVPATACPSPPAMPSFSHSGSAEFIRQVQQTYAQAASQARQACLTLNGEVRGEVERLKRQGRASVANSGLPASDASEHFGEADLQLRRAESLKREALQFRQEADRASGINGYCGTRARTRKSPEKSRDVVEALRSAGRRDRKMDRGISLDGKVVDLKAAWERKWNNGGPLDDPGPPPLPVVRGGGGAGDIPFSRDDLPDEFRVTWRDRAKDGYEKAASWYREADEQVQLTEVLTPPSPREYLKEQAKEGAKKLLVEIAGPFGKSVEAGMTILEAVKGTTEEIGEILEDAPRVIGSGSAADARELGDRAFRVPAKCLNSLFNEVTGKVDLPEYRYQYKKGWDDRP